ncbi:hypothetical protein LG943_18025 [Streptomonospora sp. S1-112]|uniref:Uncharacterized protein n=1 Tax=Streptomonospora mangrovi TaxID=2883123 RepID=A0A9X3NQL7_9ACTN|nr:hypothetical protein [Streptomonospora mangrovi]MDA0566199.1 hypothetical protein [Streptomonospora mangrovi]
MDGADGRQGRVAVPRGPDGPQEAFAVFAELRRSHGPSGAELARAADADLDRRLGHAAALYRDGRFADAYQWADSAAAGLKALAEPSRPVHLELEAAFTAGGSALRLGRLDDAYRHLTAAHRLVHAPGRLPAEAERRLLAERVRTELTALRDRLVERSDTSGQRSGPAARDMTRALRVDALLPQTAHPRRARGWRTRLLHLQGRALADAEDTGPRKTAYHAARMTAARLLADPDLTPGAPHLGEALWSYAAGIRAWLGAGETDSRVELAALADQLRKADDLVSRAPGEAGTTAVVDVRRALRDVARHLADGYRAQADDRTAALAAAAGRSGEAAAPAGSAANGRGATGAGQAATDTGLLRAERDAALAAHREWCRTAWEASRAAGSLGKPLLADSYDYLRALAWAGPEGWATAEEHFGDLPRRLEGMFGANDPRVAAATELLASMAHARSRAHLDAGEPRAARDAARQAIRRQRELMGITGDRPWEEPRTTGPQGEERDEGGRTTGPQEKEGKEPSEDRLRLTEMEETLRRALTALKVDERAGRAQLLAGVRAARAAHDARAHKGRPERLRVGTAPGDAARPGSATEVSRVPHPSRVAAPRVK